MILDLDLQDICKKLRKRELKASELAKRCSNRQATFRSTLGAYKTPTPSIADNIANAADAAFQAGIDLGPLQGIPISIKDLYGLADTATFAGTPHALPEEWQAEGPILQTLKKQCAPIVGKTHTVEFAFGGLGVNNHWGTPRNPWDASHHRVPGGSSCGAGVSLMEGSALVAYGTDTAGSVRIPASFTGTVGFKTSIGRWSRNGIVPLSPTLDTAGVLTKTVNDLAIAFAASDPYIHDWRAFVEDTESTSLSGVCIGVGEAALWDDCDAGIVETVQLALSELEAAGAILLEVKLPQANTAIELLRQGNVVAAECDEFLQAKLPTWRETLDPVVASRIKDGAGITAGEYLARQRLLAEISRQANDVFSRCDVIVCPTVPITPPRLADVQTIETYRPKNFQSLRNTCIANSLCLCAGSIPVGLDNQGMPVGMQVLGKFNQDQALLGILHAAEQKLGNSRQRLGTVPMMANHA